ncbi:MAG: glutaredoxin domain-containing protein [Cyanobium sp.]
MAAETSGNAGEHNLRLARSLKIDLYTSRFDVQCILTKGLLDRKGLEYNEYDVEDDFNREVMLKRAGGETTLPQIFVNGRSVGGLEGLTGLIEAGELDAFMGKPA